MQSPWWVDLAVVSFARLANSGFAAIIKPQAARASTKIRLRDKILCDDVAIALLKWYDQAARDLPWRVPPEKGQAGVRANPYHVWLSEVMLQQTTVAAVRPYFETFLQKWPRVDDLAAAPDADLMAAWAGLGYYARARNLLACARVVAYELDGAFPKTPDALQKLPGIGPYTAAAISAIAFGQRATVVDGNVERVMARLCDIHTPLPDAKPELTKLAQARTPATRPGDYAQAVMDLGATICTPKSPKCGDCPLAHMCKARANGTASALPKKRTKKPKPTRTGIAYVARDANGGWLLETRPPKGLLGGMLGWPTTDWTSDAPIPAPPFEAAWQETGLLARHTFTHFHLELTVQCASLRPGQNPERGRIYDLSEFQPDDLPTAMRKAYDLAKSWPGWTE